MHSRHHAVAGHDRADPRLRGVDRRVGDRGGGFDVDAGGATGDLATDDPGVGAGGADGVGCDVVDDQPRDDDAGGVGLGDHTVAATRDRQVGELGTARPAFDSPWYQMFPLMP